MLTLLSPVVETTAPRPPRAGWNDANSAPEKVITTWAEGQPGSEANRRAQKVVSPTKWEADWAARDLGGAGIDETTGRRSNKTKNEEYCRNLLVERE